jgi:spore coat polysaccharide biosynthesis protein SpsF
MAAVIIQARMGSSRLPGKTLADLGGRPVIDWTVERAAQATTVTDVIVATSTRPEDNAIAAHVQAHGIATVVRGDPTDVLSRYITSLQQTSADVIVRITGDCPFVQPDFVDRAIRLANSFDYVATGLDGRFPRGFDVEADKRSALLDADRSATDPLEREHVTLFVARHPERFASAALECPRWARRPDVRLTLDEANDLLFLRTVVSELGASPSTPLSEDLVAFLDDRPDLRAINADVVHNNVS